MYNAVLGGVAEWLIAAVLKTVMAGDSRPIVGSNPTPSAERIKERAKP